MKMNYFTNNNNWKKTFWTGEQKQNRTFTIDEGKNNEQIRYASNNTNPLRVRTKDYWL